MAHIIDLKYAPTLFKSLKYVFCELHLVVNISITRSSCAPKNRVHHTEDAQTGNIGSIFR